MRNASRSIAAVAGCLVMLAPAVWGQGDTAGMATMDPAVATGTLANGLHYMVQRNATPAKRAELRLVVNAGSVLEDADQRGMAHFVEHMAFNGTAHFPKNALVAYIQSIGMRWGADLNAHTSYDETVYYLTVPTDGSALDSGLTILTDWAGGVQFDSGNVVAERNVILEEWRLRTGPPTRIQSPFDSALYRGTPYVDRPPIGTVESITNTNPAPLKRFYKDWYRPDLMTVIVVGDFDQATMVAEIRRRFGALAAPASPRPRTQLRPAIPTTATAILSASPEQHDWIASVFFPRGTATPGSRAAYRMGRVNDMFLAIVNQRLAQSSRLAGSPLESAALGSDQLQRGEHLYRLAVSAKSHRLDDALTAALAEIDRLARDGPTIDEVEEQRKGLERVQDDQQANTVPRPSASLADQYADNALTGTISLSSAQAATRLRETVPTITPADIRAIAESIAADTTPLVLAAIPAGTESGRPTSASLLHAVAAARAMRLPTYDPSVTASAPLVPDPPTPGKITSTTRIPSVGIIDWTLSNGVRVLLKPMPHGDGKVYVHATRWGGAATADSADYASAEMASLVAAGGAGAYDNAALQRRFAGVSAGAGTEIGNYAESATGVSAQRPEDLALLFQLLYLKFTKPYLDSTVFARWKAEAQDIARVNQLALYLDAYLRNGQSFGRPVIGPLADSVDIGRAAAFYRARFGDAAGFTFVIAGDFSPDSIRPLVERYIGGLPSSGTSRAVRPRDTGARPHPGPVRHLLITGGSDPQAKTVVVYTTPLAVTRASAARVRALAGTLQLRLTRRLRQELGGVYVVEVGGTLDQVPYGRANVEITYTSDPARLDELRAAVNAELDSMRTVGPTDTELNDIKAESSRNYELAGTRADLWAERIESYATNGWPLDELGGEGTLMSGITVADVRALATALFTDLQRIEVLTVSKPVTASK